MRVCSYPGCPALTPSTRCAAHGTAVRGQDHVRNSAHLTGATHCAVCGRSFTNDNPMERGHIIPLEAGGTNAPSNYRAECRRCNRSGRL